MTDSYGDGWVGGIAGHYNTWELEDLSDNTVRTRGTLADNHESATFKECLPDGEYVFHTTATSAFADDIAWGICDHHGVAGESYSLMGPLLLPLACAQLFVDRFGIWEREPHTLKKKRFPPLCAALLFFSFLCG